MNKLDELLNDDNTLITVKTLKEILAATSTTDSHDVKTVKREAATYIEHLQNEINEMKKKAHEQKSYMMNIPIGNTKKPFTPYGSYEFGPTSYAPIGLNTGYKVSGIDLYSGDQVVTSRGLHGVIFVAQEGVANEDEEYNIFIRTHNMAPTIVNEYVVLPKEAYDQFSMPKVKLEDLTLTHNFNAYDDGEQILYKDEETFFAVSSKRSLRAAALNTLKSRQSKQEELYLEVPVYKSTYLNTSEKQFYAIGEPTGHHVEKVELYSGDEVMIKKSGLRGVILARKKTSSPSGTPYTHQFIFQAALSTYNLVTEEERPNLKGPRITAKDLHVLRHYVDIKEGDVIHGSPSSRDGFPVVPKSDVDFNKLG